MSGTAWFLIYLGTGVVLTAIAFGVFCALDNYTETVTETVKELARDFDPLMWTGALLAVTVGGFVMPAVVVIAICAALLFLPLYGIARLSEWVTKEITRPQDNVAGKDLDDEDEPASTERSMTWD